MPSTSTTPSNCSCRQPIVVAMKQPVRPIPALQGDECGQWSYFKHFSVVAEKPVSQLPLSVPAVDNNWSRGGGCSSVCLDIGHQLQQRHCGVGGFVVGPRRVPVMLQHATLIPQLHRNTHARTKDISPKPRL